MLSRVHAELVMGRGTHPKPMGIGLFHQLEAQFYSRCFDILGEKVAINLLQMLPNCLAWQRICDAAVVQGYTG
jgi:hypothetical protein